MRVPYTQHVAPNATSRAREDNQYDVLYLC